jgi:hypothetical protein
MSEQETKLDGPDFARGVPPGSATDQEHRKGKPGHRRTLPLVGGIAKFLYMK